MVKGESGWYVGIKGRVYGGRVVWEVMVDMNDISTKIKSNGYIGGKRGVCMVCRDGR